MEWRDEHSEIHAWPPAAWRATAYNLSDERFHVSRFERREDAPLSQTPSPKRCDGRALVSGCADWRLASVGLAGASGNHLQRFVARVGPALWRHRVAISDPLTETIGSVESRQAEWRPATTRRPATEPRLTRRSSA